MTMSGRRGRLSHCGGSARGHALLFLDQALAVDAVAREGDGVESLLRDRLAASLAGAVGTVLDLLERRYDVAQQSPVAVAKLEEEFTGVGGVGLITQIFDGVVLLVLAIEGGAADFLEELVLLFE